MGALLKLIGIEQPAEPQALVQAPSADLIRSDNELIMPKLEDIVCEMSLDEIDEYKKLAEQLEHPVDNSVLGLWMLGMLKRAEFRRYNLKETKDFLDKQAICLSKKYNCNLSWVWRNLQNCGPVPPRILKKIIKTLETDGNSEKESILFNVSKIVTRKASINFDLKNDREVCFLIFDTTKPRESWSKFASVIDAWRGPTFSDEEAKI